MSFTPKELAKETIGPNEVHLGHSEAGRQRTGHNHMADGGRPSVNQFHLIGVTSVYSSSLD